MTNTNTSENAQSTGAFIGEPGREVVVIVGAGPGIGASVARRFAGEGFSVGLIARNRDRLAQMATDLRETTGAHVAIATADATDPPQLRSSISTIAADLGPPSVLFFGPIPDVGLIKPLLETGPDELMASLRLNIAGAAAAVESVLPAMLQGGRGSLLFTTGSAALQPNPARAASAITTTAASVYVSLLRQALEGTGVRVGHTVIVGPIANGENSHNPDDVATDLWRHHVDDAPDFPSVLRLP